MSGRNTGNLNTQYFFGLNVIMLVDHRWNDQAVGAGASCVQTTVISGEYVCSDPETNSGVLQTTVPTSGESYTIGISALNCGNACYVIWTYRLVSASTVTQAPATPVPSSVPATGSTLAPTSEPPPGEDSGLVTPLTPVATPDEIDSDAAIGQAIGGLIAAVAIGLISAADAGVLISSILGQGPLSPDEAMTQIDRVFEPVEPVEPVQPVQPVEPHEPPEPPELVSSLPVEPPAPPAPSLVPPLPPQPPSRPVRDSHRTSQVDSSDPCGALVSNYRDSLRKWMDIQNRILPLENERWALTQYIEKDAESDFWGAASYLATLGFDTLAGPTTSSGTLDAMVSAFEQSLRRSVMTQALQAAFMGEEFDPDEVAQKAVTDAIGFRSAEQGDPTQAAFGAFLKESLTGLAAQIAGSKALRTVKASVEAGVLSAADAQRLEATVQGSFARDIGPVLGVGFKAYELWSKNSEWGEGAERRAHMRNHLVDLGTRIHELELDRAEVELSRNVDRQQLARCRAENP